MKNKNTAKFSLGELIIPRATGETIAPEDVGKSLLRHESGDWGDVCAERRQANEISLRDKGFELLSVYHDSA